MELVIAIVQQLYKKKIKITMTISFSVKAVAQSSLCHKIIQTYEKMFQVKCKTSYLVPQKVRKAQTRYSEVTLEGT